MNRHKRWCVLASTRREQGQVLILVALAMVVMMGIVSLVVDVGRITVTRRQLQNSVDAAVHAGSQALPDDPAAARTTARSWGEKNSIVGGDTLNIDVSRTNAANDTVTAAASRTVPYTFARVLGLESTTVSARAKSVVGSVTGGTGIMPFSLLDGNGPNNPGYGYNYEDNYVIKEHDGGSWRSGNRGFLAFDGHNGGSNLRDVLSQGGSDTLYKVGDWVPTEPGNTSGPGKQGMEAWAASHNDSMTGSTCNNWDAAHSYVSGKLQIIPQCRYRVVLVPIIYYPGCNPQPCWPNGRKDVQIVGFAQMYIAGWSTSVSNGNGNGNGNSGGNQTEDMNAVFLDDSWSHPNIVLGALDSFGTRISKITE